MNLRRNEEGEYELQRRRKWEPGYYVRWEDEGGKHIAWVGTRLSDIAIRLHVRPDGDAFKDMGITALVIESKYAAKYGDHIREDKLPWEDEA